MTANVPLTETEIEGLLAILRMVRTGKVDLRGLPPRLVRAIREAELEAASRTTIMPILTSRWWTPLPPDHVRIGISRGVPKGMRSGYRLYRKLAPGPWFNTVGWAEYARRYRVEVLDPLNPLQVARELEALAGEGGVPVLVCYEKPLGPVWCHRSLAAAWLSDALGQPVPEFCFEHLDQDHHPCLHEGLRRS